MHNSSRSIIYPKAVSKKKQWRIEKAFIQLYKKVQSCATSSSFTKGTSCRQEDSTLQKLLFVYKKISYTKSAN